MSDVGQIQAALGRAFHAEGQRIVFWNDPDREFEGALSELNLDGVTTLRLDQFGTLEVKIRVEREEPTDKYLLYSPAEEPDSSATGCSTSAFTAEASGPIARPSCLQELGLTNQHAPARTSPIAASSSTPRSGVQKLKPLVAAGPTSPPTSTAR